MSVITVLTKHSQGNETVGEVYTISKEYDSNTPIGQIYKEMTEIGNWDITVPRNQIHLS